MLLADGTFVLGGSGVKPYTVMAIAAAAATAAMLLRTSVGAVANERTQASGLSLLGLVRARTSAQTSSSGTTSGTAARRVEKRISSSSNAAHSGQVPK